MKPARLDSAWAALRDQLAEKGIDIREVQKKVMDLWIELPSWAFGNSGTRFKVFKEPGIPRDPFEKMEDAAQVLKFTGVSKSVALHIPWDKVDDYAKLRKHAASLGLKIGSISPNIFQEYDYKFGSLAHSDARVRAKAMAHFRECVQIVKDTGSVLFTPWMADGTNYPGQGDFRRRRRWMEEGFRTIYGELPKSVRMLIEYKFFEPAFYHTDIADWGISLQLAQALGDRAQVLVDLGHHALGTNIEWIVAMLIDFKKLGGFHFNSKKYADDDLTVGSTNPYELFLILNEIVAGELDPSVNGALDVAYMIDESPTLKPKIESMIQSVSNVQETYARALLVDRKALAVAREANAVIDAEEALTDAFRTDVRPLLAKARIERGLDPNPLAAFRRTDYVAQIVKARGFGEAAPAARGSARKKVREAAGWT